MLLFLHRWDYCWKCEFDADAKIEKEIIITMMENDYKRVTYQNTEEKERRMFLQSLYCKKQRILIYLTKTVLKTTSNAIFNMKRVDLDES